MCGIFCKLKRMSNGACEGIPNNMDDKVISLLNCRGPDICHSSSCCRNDSFLYMFGATLWMQGGEPCSQPQETDNAALLFNGDVYNKYEDVNRSDTEDILMKFTHNNFQEEDIEVIRNITGPFSLIYLDKRKEKLYFCRDRFGRKSLMLYKNNDDFIISSVLGKEFIDAIELPPTNIYSLNIRDSTITGYPWNSDESESRILNLDDLLIVLQSYENESDEFGQTEMSSEVSILFNEVEKLASEIKCRKHLLKKFLTIDFFSQRVDKLIDLLSESVKVRVSTQPPYCKVCIGSKNKCQNHCRVAVLFSGGLDCTVLAALAHKHVPSNESIDLLNVAFQHKNCENFQVPDRVTSLQSLDELQRLFPERKWNLLQINVTTDELLQKQIEIISDLVHPLQTILDESLGSALWFAARGKIEGYESTARVVLMGMGADELFGGYTRHRNAFNRGGWNALGKELDLDWRRLPSRNLARDDRIVSHHGRQPRTPYLDEDFVKFVLHLQPWERCFPSKCCEVGVGDKLLLRLAAMKIGLECTSVFPKRAIQFGSRIANKNENAKDVSPRLIKLK